jgi:hypothetical protein
LTRSVRFILLASVCALALAFGGNAFAAYNPALIVAGSSNALGSGGPMVIGIEQDINDDATAAIVIYSPLGYGVTLGQAPGTQLGVVDAIVKLPIGGTFVRAPFEGRVLVDNPANYLNNPCTRNPAPHQAVWVIDGTLAGNQIRIPMYVDRITSGTEAAFASARIRLCLPSPYIPPQQGGAVSGASVIAAAFSVQGVFSNPNTRGRYPWQSIFVPYTVGTGTPNPGNSAQSSSIVGLPAQLALTARKVRRGKLRFARLTACLSEAGRGVRGIRISFRGGRSPGARTVLKRARTNARGCATVLVRLRFRRSYFRATGPGVADQFDIPFRDVTSGGCGTPTLAPRCSAATLSGVFRVQSSVVRVRR